MKFSVPPRVLFLIKQVKDKRWRKSDIFFKCCLHLICKVFKRKIKLQRNESAQIHNYKKKVYSSGGFTSHVNYNIFMLEHKSGVMCESWRAESGCGYWVLLTGNFPGLSPIQSDLKCLNKGNQQSLTQGP